MTTIWSFPTRVMFGVGAVQAVGGELAGRGGARVLVVTDAGVRAAGLLEPVLAALRAANIEAAVFDGVEGNPLERHVEAGVEAYRAAAAEALVAVGGGSPMDAAKVIALRLEHHGPLEAYDDFKGGDRLVTGEVPPIVAIPTTAGTGSEVGRAGVVTPRATGRKTIIFSPKLLPALAVLDPEMTRSMPPRVTAATGYDALTHCVEAYVATGDHPMADAIALGGIRLVARSLVRAVEQGDDLEARGDMMKAAMMGAVAFQKGLGACHALAHPLSALCDLHHGLANAICLPAVARFNQAAAPERYAEIARIFGAGDEGCDEALATLRARVGLPATLAEAGLADPPFEALADEAFADGSHGSNPRPCTRDDLLALYRASA